MPESRRVRVLVVDDVWDNRAILSRRLVRRGFEVAEAAGGREALEKLRTEPFDIVLLDIMMPDISGLDVLREIRTTLGMAELPVLMVSAAGEHEEEALRRGANGCLTKPVDFEALIARMGELLGGAI